MTSKNSVDSTKPNVQSLRKIHGGKVRIKIIGINENERWSDSLPIPFNRVSKKISSLKKDDF